MFQSLVIARYGVFAALAAAALSVWLGQRAGASLDYAITRGVMVFVVIVGLALAAEFVMTDAAPPAPAKDDKKDEEEATNAG